jgi:hypothetical protein
MPTIPDYLIDPVGFAKAALGLKLYPWQEAVLWDLNLPGAVALRAANESGKTSIVGASAALWHAVAFPGSLTICTASVYRQVSEQLFPTLHQHAGKFPGGVFNASDVTLANGSRILGFATDEANKFEGWHNSHLLIIADEAKGIPDSIFEAVERCAPTRLLVMSSPGGCNGFFYAAFNSKRKFFRTHVVTAFECPHIARERIDSQIAKYGRSHPLIASMIFAEWMTGDADGCVIPLAFVERTLANPPAFKDDGSVAAFCDFAAGGDENVLAVRRGNSVSIAAAWREPDTMKAVGKFIQLFREQNLTPAQISGDEGGLGTVVCDRLAEVGWPIRRVNNGATACDGEHYANKGAEIWFNGRTQLEKQQLILPDDPELVAQLTARHGWPDSRGRLQLESKADMRSRGLTSPDRADAVLGAMAKLTTGGAWDEAAVKATLAANPFLQHTDGTFNRDAAKAPFRLQSPGGQFPSTPNLSRMGVWTPTRTFTPRR